MSAKFRIFSNIGLGEYALQLNKEQDGGYYSEMPILLGSSSIFNIKNTENIHNLFINIE